MYYAKPEKPKRGASPLSTDFMGSAVVEEIDFRKFKSVDMTLPLAYRSDKRLRGEIFSDGFYPRFKYNGKEYQAVIRLGNYDMHTDYAAPHLEYAKEVASLGVPKEQVLGLIKLKATYDHDTNSFNFNMTKLMKNPNCGKHRTNNAYWAVLRRRANC